ncbi:ABC1 kinase family protein [Oligoflexus tunisiensis]|uniref:ABC1 kinase family protein n=1 Tax=Oligoflexus tunisiensis TaxID=708132 RepID=UPI00114CB8AC|nr:AarF/UbiB family protein [Oligoflexus tunisiensis]
MKANTAKTSKGSRSFLGGAAAQHLALAREITCIYKQLLFSGGIALPLRVSRAFLMEPGIDPFWSEKRILELVGDVALACFNSLGPVYGKLGQIALSRLDDEGQQLAQKMQLTRLYGAWPAIPFEEIEAILDEEIPDWQQEFVVEPHPLGVASMAQVHAAVDEEGREWVIKVIKPESCRRLEETLRALEQIVTLTSPLKLTSVGSKTIRELQDLIRSLRREVQLDLEKKNLDRMQERLDSKKQQVLRLPKTFDRFCTPNVLVMERFRGASLVDVVEGRMTLNAEQRKKLARRILQELLVQVFEIGLFHADPHAGNLMLLEDGCVGLFDWGLTGELREVDRRHISGILKALLMADMQRLIDVLVNIGEEHDVHCERADVEAELRKVSSLIQEHREAGTQASMEELLEAALRGSENLGIPVPDGLLMMAKSLLTIEGLARGIDPEVSFARAAGPVLLKAARPNLKEVIGMGRRLPHLVKKMFDNAS